MINRPTDSKRRRRYESRWIWRRGTEEGNSQRHLDDKEIASTPLRTREGNDRFDIYNVEWGVKREEEGRGEDCFTSFCASAREWFNGSDEIRRNAGIKQGIQGDGSFSHVDRIQFGVSLG